MIKVYYAKYATASYREFAVVLLDDAIPEEEALARSGYFERLVTPEGTDGPAEGPDRG
jgi:hypothetical protein